MAKVKRVVRLNRRGYAERWSAAGDGYEVEYDSGALVEFHQSATYPGWFRVSGIAAPDVVKRIEFQHMMQGGKAMSPDELRRLRYGGTTIDRITAGELPSEVQALMVERGEKRLAKKLAREKEKAERAKLAPALRAAKNLEAWAKRLKTAERCVKKWKKKVAYYKRKGLLDGD